MIAHIPSIAGYAGVALLVGGESAGLPVPGETTLVAAAVLASQGRLSLPLVIAVAAAAAIVGDNVGYLGGRRGGRWLLTRPGRWEERRGRLLARGEAFFERHGAPPTCSEKPREPFSAESDSGSSRSSSSSDSWYWLRA